MGSDSRLQLQAWKALSKYLHGTNEDQEYWWKVTGRHVASLLEAAEYPLEKQFECLLFHYRWTVSLAFPSPEDWATNFINVFVMKDPLHGPCPWARWHANQVEITAVS